MFALFALLSLTAPAEAATQVYRCQDTKGQAMFSDTPCGKDAQTVTIRQPSVIQSLPRAQIDAAQMPDPPKARPAARTDNCPTPQAIAQAIFRKQVLLCMSTTEVDRAADPAMRENFRSLSGADAQGSYQERYYGAASDDWPRYIKFRNNRVAEFHEEAPVPACPPHCARQDYTRYPLPYPPRYPLQPGQVYPGNPAYPAYPYAQPEPQPEPRVDIQIRLGNTPEPPRQDEDH
ncbi:MAG: DUF4124 domain-containing protein [Gammaproteobacteria bacterium]|nr:DUF4124 domain-containing protein [Gammaproteobacteria bacterium]